MPESHWASCTLWTGDDLAVMRRIKAHLHSPVLSCERDASGHGKG